METQSDRVVQALVGTSEAKDARFVDALSRSVALAEEIDALLAIPSARLQSGTLLRVRLARALVLGVVDQLEDLVNNAR